MVENVIHIKSGVMINVDVGVKNIVYVKKIISGILLNVVAQNVNISQILYMIPWLRVMKL